MEMGNEIEKYIDLGNCADAIQLNRNEILSPFIIFPEEVWEHILGRLEESSDILRVFQAWPMLRGQVLKNSYWWLFDQVVPFIFNWVRNEELLSCRLVCKRWCLGVDNFLENHPARRPVLRSNSCEVTSVNIWGPDSLTLFVMRSRSPTRDNALRDSRLLPLMRLSRLRFILNMGAVELKRNPFIGRSLEVSDVDTWRCYHITHQDFWDEVLPFISKFGGHIWFLSLECRTKPVFFCEVWLGILHWVPNLKCLRLLNVPRGDDLADCQRAEHFLSFLKPGSLPPLPFLETLDIQDLPLSFPSSDYSTRLANILIAAYSSQITTLGIHFSNWKSEYEYSNRFPCLAQLTVKDGYAHEVKSLLQTLYSPKLCTLVLSETIGPSVPMLESIGRMMVTQFPCLTSLTISPWLSEERDCPMEFGADFVTPVVSLRSLQFQLRSPEHLNINLLRFFPSLERLKIVSHDKLDVSQEEDMFQPKLWEVILPKLKVFTLVGGGTLPRGEAIPITLTYTRERYEWLKMQKRHP